MKYLKFTHSLLAAVLLAASAASCGEGDDDEDGDEPEPWEYPDYSGGAGSGNASIPSCTLKWNQSQGATSYIVYRSSSENSGYSQLSTTNYPSYVDETVKIGNTYYYRVKAKNSKGTSDYSNTCKYEFLDQRKPGPAKITSATCSGSNINVRWSVPTDRSYGKPSSGSIMVANPSTGKAVEVKTFSASATSVSFGYGAYISSVGSVTFAVRLTNEHGYSESVVIYDTKNNKFFY